MTWNNMVLKAPPQHGKMGQCGMLFYWVCCIAWVHSSQQIIIYNHVIYGGFLKWGYPQLIHFNGTFHHKPSILGHPHLWKPPQKVHRPCMFSVFFRWHTHGLSHLVHHFSCGLFERIKRWRCSLWISVDNRVFNFKKKWI